MGLVVFDEAKCNEDFDKFMSNTFISYKIFLCWNIYCNVLYSFIYNYTCGIYDKGICYNSIFF